MQNTRLYDQWRAMDDRRLANKPISVRLPVHVLARINAIADIFPTKTRTDLLTDLLKAGLEAFENSMPPVHYSAEPYEVEPGLVLSLPVGPTAEYQQNSNKHYHQLEQDLGNSNPADLFEITSKEFKAR